MTKKQWWKEAIVYQIYPRSFKDSNGDGIGDLRGIIEKLDYIQALGVDTVWLNPIYKSPNDDGGYDISDYYTLQPEFGTIEDFDELVDGLHSRGLKLVMDLVVNHSSDEHVWFEQSRKSKDNPYRNFYFWRPGKNGGPPNNWPSFFGGSAWEKDDATGEYYLHLFSRKQPDLNWENPRLRREVAALMEYWLEKGVDGLRLDVISAISKRTSFPDSDTPDFNETIRKYYANGPRLKEFIREMRTGVWDHYRVMTVGEGPGITPENAVDYLDERDGLHMIFHFGHMFMDQGPGGRFDPIPWSLTDFKKVFQTWDDALRDKGWGSIFLGNHDFARMVSRWGNDKEHWAVSSKMLITLMLTMRGTPYIFQGDELGMTNLALGSVAESKDIETQNGWREASKRGMSEQDFVAVANYSGRDNARTPVQWSGKKHAGFTTGEPWMKVNPNYPDINAERQSDDPNSVLSYFRKMTRLRRGNHAFVYGDYLPISTPEEFLFAYDRVEAEEKWRVLLNFSDNNLNLPDQLIPATAVRVMGNYPSTGPGDLRPWEAIILRL
ncbi:MAG TPA: glucohydrolase [Cytophagales bacterium]|nr:glucohydrolase [Cytophagales bacterium]